MKGYYLITDSAISRAGNLSDVRSALKAGVRIVQYREKHKNTKEMHREAVKLRKICKNITFLINDRVDIALAVGADGVHLGSNDLPYVIARKLLGRAKTIGITVHNLKEAREAERLGADYLGVSPIFGTKTKVGAGHPVGAGLIKKIKKYVSIPVIAIGGINLFNARQVIHSGADGLCAISAVLKCPDVRGEIEKFQGLFKER